MRTGSCRRRGGGPASRARWRPTRAAAATAGSYPKGASRAPTGGPEDIRPPATTSRARPQGAKGTPKVIPQGTAPQRVPEERWSRRLEASRPMRPGRENRGDATGRPTLKIHFRRPLLAFIQGPGSASGVRPGWIPRARYSRQSPHGRRPGGTLAPPRAIRQSCGTTREEPPMTDAVIVSTARTPIGKAYRGAFNNTHGATLAGHAIKHAVERAGIEPGEVEDVLIGCALPEGATGENIARQAAIRAGLPVTTSGATVNRFCSSGMQTIALAAQRVIVDNVPVMVAGGRRVGEPRAERAQEQAPPARRMARPAQARDLPADDRHRRGRGEALQDQPRGPGPICAAEPAAHRRGPAGRPLRRRDRAAADDEARAGQGDGRHQRAGGDARPATRATGPTPRPRAWRSSSRCGARAPSSPPAMRASSPTAPRPASS